LNEINHPHLRACLDVGHAHLFTDNHFAFDDWLESLAPWLSEIHMNNNNGILDEHHGFDWQAGVLNYQEILPKIRAINPQVAMVLEMDLVQDMRDSLHYFEIDETIRE
jgi:sugar phosphate isomerase/epimerase